MLRGTKMSITHGAHALLSWHGGMAGRWGFFVSQGKYANEILRIFRMESSKPMETPLAGN